MEPINKTISLIIPVYNTEQYFDRCLQSVLSQTYTAMEIIVVNDASQGDIDERIQSYLQQDTRILYLRHDQNQGLFRARVTGMSKATGDYVAFLDSDDYISRDFYRTLIERAEETDADIVIGKTVWDNGDSKYVYNLHDSCFHFDVMEGESIRQAYFSQEAGCYAWHTIWNKLYRASLVSKCFPVFDRIREHIIMTEDICFSSIFFYNAERLARVEEEAYFYCSNETASTSTSNISLNRYLKNVRDMTLVFDHVDAFLCEQDTCEEIRNHFAGARRHYARMWQNLLDISFSGSERSKGLQALKAFCADYTMDHVQDDFFYESIRTPWNGALEYFKERIAFGPEQYISFDIFDTLILRPFYQPEDLLKLMDPLFQQLTGSQTSFFSIRQKGEQIARSEHARIHPNHQDITLTEIYNQIAETYRLDKALVHRMQQEEIRLEIRFTEARPAGRSLYSMARASGKKILFVSDMYLERDTICQILQKNGFGCYDQLYISSEERALKYSGDLFRCVLRDHSDAAQNTIHIGDTWKSDIEGTTLAGFDHLFLPKTREFFEGTLNDYATGQCSTFASRMCGTFLDRHKLMSNPGLRTMLAIASQKYFDRPYRCFCPDSDMNADPWFIGYYLVGMHLMGLCKWIHSQVRSQERKTIHFLSRDGYLPMKAYELYSRYVGSEAEISYLYTSRKALLPIIAADRTAFYHLPVEYRAHTPMSLMKLLSFAYPDCSDNDLRAMFRKQRIDPDKYIADDAECFDVIHCFLEHLYDEDYHVRARATVEDYFSQIKPGDIAFDMGYSGRIQAAISQACHRGVDVLFVHQDYDRSVHMKRLGDFDISSFYDFRPTVSGLFREHLLSDCAGSCIGYRNTDSGTVPIIEESVKHCTDSFVINSIQTGALAFVEDYLHRFGDMLDQLDYSPLEVSLPLEGFMRHPSAIDLQIFRGSYFEDEVYGGRKELNIEQFLLDQVRTLDCASTLAAVQSPPPPSDPSFVDVITPKPQWLRAIIWLLVDFDSFKARLKLNLNRIFKRFVR